MYVVIIIRVDVAVHVRENGWYFASIIINDRTPYSTLDLLATTCVKCYN